MEKRQERTRKCKEVSISWLDKNWVDAYIRDFKKSNKRFSSATGWLSLGSLFDIRKTSSPEDNGVSIPAAPHQQQISKIKLSACLIRLSFDPSTRTLIQTSRQWLLVNMTSILSFSRPKGSRIKFKRDSGDRDRSIHSSQPTVVETPSFSLKDSSSSKSLNGSELLDLKTCYHPQCSFAYYITRRTVREGSLIAECLPPFTFQRLAALWHLDPNKASRGHGNKCKMDNTVEEDELVEEYIRNVERDLGMRSDISDDLQVNVRSYGSDSLETANTVPPKENVYLKFLRSGEEDQKNRMNLHKKTKTVTKVIIKHFLDWYRSLGGSDNESLVDEATLHELFQIGFDMPEVKALIIGIKELPTVPGCLAALRNEPQHATRYALRKLLKQDIKKENIPLKMFAFGSMLPKEHPPLRYKPPRNNVRKTWMECERVPSDLDTMKTIWGGLEKLRSTIAFSNWLKNHPEISPPTYLQQKGLLKINYEEWNQMYKGFELDVDTVEVVASDMKVIQEKSLVQEPRLSEIGSIKFDSYNSLL